MPDEVTLYKVHSQVRGRTNRTVRAKGPSRHRFKQHILGGSRRLLRNRPVMITEALLVEFYEELKIKDMQGILSVHTMDGRRIDLSQMKAAKAPLPAPKPVGKLDSIADDKPAGLPLETRPGGIPQGDPAQARSAERLEDEKKEEVETKPEPPDGEGTSRAEAQPETEVKTNPFATEVLEEVAAEPAPEPTPELVKSSPRGSKKQRGGKKHR